MAPTEDSEPLTERQVI